ncbi:MAG: CTP synthase [Patescibacteria group bacterium]|nr:CTP synthase [Patescibacteria group bacterium]
MKKTRTKFIFVVGGVMSGVGKGVTTSSIAQILSNKGYSVSAIKMDPYINVDAGTMNPVEHGEVFVTEDGDETDQDIGNYERFLNKNIYKENYMTTGRVYQSVISKERNLAYEGKCVQVIPHIPMEIRDRIKKAADKNKAEIMVIEIGGTVGEYENLLFLEAARVMKLKNPEDVLFVMVSYLPIPNKIGEMKTKPTQHAVRSLNTAGIQPNFIVARSEKEIDDVRRGKIAIHCNVSKEDVIAAPDIDSIYEIPVNFEKNNFGNKILKKLELKSKNTAKGKESSKKWMEMINNIKNPQKEIKVAIVGKYFATGDFSLSDSYISVIEAIKHAAAHNKVKINLEWIGTEDIEKNGLKILKNFAGVIVPQGWGSRGSEGKIETIKYCREKKIPYLGLCYGMQMAVIEFARNVCGLKDATSEEINPKSKNKVIHIMPEQAELIKKKGYGGTIRLGAWPCKMIKNTRLEKAYSKMGFKDIINERHRHRYEFNNDYQNLFEKNGLIVSGTSPDGKIVESIEIKDHPFFVGVQFHPEYISRPLAPHPLFVEFVKVLKNLK